MCILLAVALLLSGTPVCSINIPLAQNSLMLFAKGSLLFA
jgi:hypothetical protein